MPRLHSAIVAPGLESEKKTLDQTIQYEAREAARIQRETGCSRTEALRLAAQQSFPHHKPLNKDE